MTDDMLEQTTEGRAWAAFCDTLLENGRYVLSRPLAQSSLDRAEGLRHVTRVARLALEQFVENYDPLHPWLWRGCRENIKLGADNPDTIAYLAPLDARYDYCLRGKRNSVRYLSIGTYYGKDYGKTGRAGCGGSIEGDELILDDGGRFEIIISATEKPGQWLRMDPDTYQLIIRQTFLDRETEKLAHLEISRVTPVEDGSGLDLPTFTANLEGASKYLTGSVSVFNRWAEAFSEDPNKLAELPSHLRSAGQTDPTLVYYMGYWRVAQDEALVITVMPPECEYWSMQINNIWMESLDFRTHRIGINKHGAAYEPDGSIRIIVSHRDPGHPNWLQLAAHLQGTMTFRWIKASRHPVPNTALMPFDRL